MTGLGYKTWTRERLTVGDLQGFIQDQTVMRFASAAARTAQLPSPQPGMVTYLADTDRYEGRTAAGTWVLLADGITTSVDVVTTVPGAAGIVTAATGFTMNSVQLTRHPHGMASLYVRVVRSGAAITVQSDGDIPNTNIANLVAAAYRPAAITVPAAPTVTGPVAVGRLSSSGALDVIAVAPGFSFATNATFDLCTPAYPLATP